MSIESVTPSNHLFLCRSLLLLPSIFPSIRIFSNESVLSIRWPSIGVSPSASVLPMNIQDWFPLGLTGLVSFCSPRDSQESSPAPNSKALILQPSAFFIVHFLHPYMTTGKTIALIRWTFVGKVMSLFFLICCLLLLLLLRCFSRVWLCATPEAAAHQASPSLGFSRQEHWSGLPFPSPMHESEKWKWSCSVVSDSSQPPGLQPTRLFRLGWS